MIRKSLAVVMGIMFLLSPNPGFGQSPSSLLSLNAKLSKIHSPETLSKYMRKNFKFIEDDRNFGKTDYWQSPTEMLERKKGDCEDFALFADAALKDLGFESWVVSLYGKNGFAHTVAVFKQDGKYRVLNDGKLYKYDSATIEELLSKVEVNWTWAAFTERKNDRGWINAIFYNPAFQPQSNII